jgi:iron complex outermembrane receptor protein
VQSAISITSTLPRPLKLTSISASVTNLTNKFYYFGKNDASQNVGTANGLVGRPREWAVTVRRTF